MVPLIDVFQRVNICGGTDWVVHRSDNEVEEGHSLRSLHGRRIGDVKDVLVAHLESCCQEISRWIPEVDVVDNWNDRSRVFRAIEPKLRGHFARFTAIKKDIPRFRVRIAQATSFGDSFRQRYAPSTEGELSLRFPVAPKAINVCGSVYI